MAGVFGLRDVRTEQIVRTWNESNNYGYFGGGYGRCTIDRLDFSSETVSLPTSQLTQAKVFLAAVSNSNYGYFGGGYAPPVNLATIDRLDFSSETVSLPTSQLTQGRRKLAAVFNSNYGYFAGGTTGSAVCTIDRLDFSNETIAIPVIPAKLTQTRYALAAVRN